MRCAHLSNFTFIEIDTNRQAAKTEARLIAGNPKAWSCL